MTFQIIERTDTYDKRGNIKSSQDIVRFETDDVVATVKFRYAVSANGYKIEANYKPNGFNRYFVTLRDGKEIEFADIFRIVEGEDAFLAVMNDERPAQIEAEWIKAR